MTQRTLNLGACKGSVDRRAASIKEQAFEKRARLCCEVNTNDRPMRFSRLRYAASITPLDAGDAHCDALHLATEDKLFIDVAKRLATTVIDSGTTYPMMVMIARQALAISSELGMRPLMERVLSRREILKA
jgi:hypothetical protein